MSVEVLPLGVRCNLRCTYCYQEPIRAAGNEGHPQYDMAAMQRTLTEEGQNFAVFGGEPLLVPIKDLEELWRFGLERFGKNGIQTNGSLLTESHLALLHKYAVGIGFSIDGPGTCNRARVAGSAAETDEATEQSIYWLQRCLEEKISASLIVTLHRLNGVGSGLQMLTTWLQKMIGLGLGYVNIHLLEVDNPGVREELALSSEENVAALMALDQLQINTNPLGTMRQLLQGDDSQACCTWHSCDPYTTAAVRGVDGQGNRNNCGRTCKEGPAWEKAATPGYERYMSLYYTPLTFGGCGGCRFFSMCKGHCPGEGLDGDWRRKTEHCSTLMQLFETLEGELLNKGITPLSLSLQRRSTVESNMLQAWQSGRNLSLTAAAQQVDVPHSDTPHIDTPHIDHTDSIRPHITHSDHNDAPKDATWRS